MQVGTATYIVSQLHGRETDRIASVLDRAGFWDALRSDPFKRREWLEAVRLAPALKENFITVLSARDCLPDVERIIDSDPRLSGCFVEG